MVVYTKNKKSGAGIFSMPRIYYITRNLGRMSDSKSILSSWLIVSQIFHYSNILARKSSLSVYIFGFFLITVILSSFSSKYLFKVLLEISRTLDTSS